MYLIIEQNEKILKAINNDIKKYSFIEKERVKLLDNLNQEVIFLKRQLKYILFFNKILKAILAAIKFIPKIVKKYSFYILNKIFNLLIKFKIFRSFISSKVISRLFKLLSDIIPFDVSKFYFEKVIKKSRKIELSQSNLLDSNVKLISHYENSKGAKFIRELFNNKKSRG